MRTVPYPEPGHILLHEYLLPLGLSQSELAGFVGLPEDCIEQLLAGKRPITAEIDRRLSGYFGTSLGYWIGLQRSHDAAMRGAVSKLRDRH